MTLLEKVLLTKYVEEATLSVSYDCLNKSQSVLIMPLDIVMAYIEDNVPLNEEHKRFITDIYDNVLDNEASNNSDLVKMAVLAFTTFVPMNELIEIYAFSNDLDNVTPRDVHISLASGDFTLHDLMMKSVA